MVELMALSLILTAATPAGAFSMPCAYLAHGANGELTEHPGCADVRGNILTLAPRHLRALAFTDHGLADVWVGGQWYYVRKNGQSLRVVDSDHGPDPYSDGLTRVFIDGKMAYFNKAFRPVLKTKYDWGWPFENGRAMVCLGCESVKPAGAIDWPVQGGLWGYIDKTGTEVVPVKFSQRELPSGLP